MMVDTAGGAPRSDEGDFFHASRVSPVPSAFVAFDCETTGLNADRDALLQLAAVAVTPQGVRTWSTLVDPGRPVGLAVVRLTGITPERLVGAPSPAAALAEFRGFVGELPLVAHHAAFDLGFVSAGLRCHQLQPLQAPVYDTLELARLVDPAAASHRLGDLTRARGIELDQAHDALSDARATAALFVSLLSELGETEPRLLGTLAYLLRRVPGPLARLVAGLAPAGSGPVLVHRRLPPPVRDESTAAEVGPAGDPAALLEPGSDLARRLQSFEVRSGQRRMLAAVAAAFETERHLMVEAGTGTGKSLAYLLPALAFARARRSRVVVSTRTVQLQEQLVGKDLPLALGSAVGARAALLKGRAHYVCLKLWEERLAMEADPADAPFLARVARWLAQTETGDRAEIGLYGEDEERFASLSADAVACTGRRCPLYEACFLFRARRRAEQADVVVVNYALLFSDLATGGGVLPEYEYLVCDEAHHLEDEACQHLGRTLSERALDRYVRLLERPAGAHTAGLLPAMRSRLEPLAGGATPAGALAARQLGGALRGLEQVRAGSREFFDGLRAWAGGRPRGSGPGRDARFEPRPEAGSDPAWDAVIAGGARLGQGLNDLAETMGAAAEALDDSDEGEAAYGDGERAAELRTAAGSAAQLAGDVALTLEGRDGWVTWCEVAQTRGGSAGAVVVRASPVDPGAILARDLFAPRRSVVMTSATLTVGGGFEYLRRRLGLHQNAEAERVDELQVESPFSYREQALLGLPSDVPRPRPGDPRGQARALAPWLVRLFRASRGHALVLCTSNALMRALRDELRPTLEAEGIACLAQGLDGSRGALADALLRCQETVVLGAASFWEGVDLPGDALRLLVIAQLPFWPPDMPLQQARQEAIAARGGSPFGELQLPAAVLRFKQGFGRLIRTASDRGVAVVLDSRLVTASYGRAFVRSLPGPHPVVGDRERVLRAVERWLDTPAAP